MKSITILPCLIFTNLSLLFFCRSLRHTYCHWQMLHLTNQGQGRFICTSQRSGTLEFRKSSEFCLLYCYLRLSFILQVYNWELWQDMPSVGHGLRHRAAHPRRSQKRGVCNCIQQPLWVISSFGITFIVSENYFAPFNTLMKHLYILKNISS